MQKILLDTNLLIYREDNIIISEQVQELTKILYDSNNYKIVIHPKTLEDLSHIKNSKQRDILYSKIKIYDMIDKPPKAGNDFHNLVGCNKLPNDNIDNNLLYAVYRDCVSYLITNDKKLIKKAKKLHLDNKVFDIETAINFFKPLEEKEVRVPAFIEQEYLYNLDINDCFFDSLKKDYKDFEIWFKKKAQDGFKAYITKGENNKITSFLMLKVEDENEDYSDFDKPFKKNRRLKISTFKVANTGNKIGESYIKIIIEEAKRKKLSEIYVTTFEQQTALINLFLEYGFKAFTYKNTIKADYSHEKELVLLKNMNDDTYPNFCWTGRNVFIVPIKQQYHEMLFPESEKVIQYNLGDLKGINTYANSIKKAYICNANTKQIKPGDILLFYASGQKKKITTIGIVDNVFSNFKSWEDLYNMAIKRTVYTEDEIKNNYKNNSLLILFKYYKALDAPITYEELKKKEILKAPPMSIVKIENSKTKKIEKIIER